VQALQEKKAFEAACVQRAKAPIDAQCKATAQTPAAASAAGLHGLAGSAAATPASAASAATPPQEFAAAAFMIVLSHTRADRLLVAMLALLGFGTAITLAFGVNAFSLHSMYGNRLIRAYLGATRPERQPHWFTGFDPEDNMPMAAVLPKRPRLFHVVNIALNLAEAAGDRLEWQQRKAAPFTVSPLHCGSASLAFVPTQRYGKPRQRAREDVARTRPAAGMPPGSTAPATRSAQDDSAAPSRSRARPPRPTWATTPRRSSPSR